MVIGIGGTMLLHILALIAADDKQRLARATIPSKSWQSRLTDTGPLNSEPRPGATGSTGSAQPQDASARYTNPEATALCAADE
jgi:hypothetical protein